MGTKSRSQSPAGASSVQVDQEMIVKALAKLFRHEEGAPLIEFASTLHDMAKGAQPFISEAANGEALNVSTLSFPDNFDGEFLDAQDFWNAFGVLLSSKRKLTRSEATALRNQVKIQHKHAHANVNVNHSNYDSPGEDEDDHRRSRQSHRHHHPSRRHRRKSPHSPHHQRSLIGSRRSSETTEAEESSSKTNTTRVRVRRVSKSRMEDLDSQQDELSDDEKRKSPRGPERKKEHRSERSPRTPGGRRRIRRISVGRADGSDHHRPRRRRSGSNVPRVPLHDHDDDDDDDDNNEALRRRRSGSNAPRHRDSEDDDDDDDEHDDDASLDNDDEEDESSSNGHMASFNADDDDVQLAMLMAMAAAENPHLKPADIRKLVGEKNKQTKIVSEIKAEKKRGKWLNTPKALMSMAIPAGVLKGTASPGGGDNNSNKSPGGSEKRRTEADMSWVRETPLSDDSSPQQAVVRSVSGGSRTNSLHALPRLVSGGDPPVSPGGSKAKLGRGSTTRNSVTMNSLYSFKTNYDA